MARSVADQSCRPQAGADFRTTGASAESAPQGVPVHLHVTALGDPVQVSVGVVAQAVCPNGSPIWMYADAGPDPPPVRNAVGPATTENLINPFRARLSVNFSLRSP